jgi:Ca2+-binding RTX toxin-like protein
LIQFGDSANIVYYLDSSSPKLLTTINCSDGGADTLTGGSGVVDYIVGGGYNDHIEGNDGMDLVFGDHARIDLFVESHKLKYATTTNTGCTGGDDTITLGEGDDIVSADQYRDCFLTSLLQF